MKNSILIASAFLTGILFGYFFPGSAGKLPSQWTHYVLLVLLFIIGIGIGANVKIWRSIRKMHFKITLVPLSAVIGTLFGAGLVSVFLNDIDLNQTLAIGAGFGYYSLSSVIIAQMEGDFLGTVALVSNLMREITTLIMAPLFVRFFGKIAPIASGGATAMDTTLPIIVKTSGKEFSIVSIFSGMVLTLLVPLLVPLLIRF
jgi:uncharacterized membrane protein YbjE (DUF340 family)